MPARVRAGILFLIAASPALAGGGGVMQTDRCVVRLGFMEAHLTIYQPRTQGSEKFCDAVPDAANTILTLDYLHDSLNQVPIEFRVIRNETGLGRFARWSDVEALGDLEAITIHYQEPVVRPGGTFQVEQRFEKEGDYLLLVTARHPTKDLRYHAVVPLAVGGSAWYLWAGTGLGMGVVLATIVWRMRRPRVKTP